MSSTHRFLKIFPLSEKAFAPYGKVLGGVSPKPHQSPSFSNSATDFWHEHLFDTGVGGETEVLWVNYRRTDAEVASLEVHRLTEQAIVPLSGPIFHVVARSLPDGRVDVDSLAVFAIPQGLGICMSPGCWHASRVPDRQVSCLMLTRRSTTADLVSHLIHGDELRESALATLDPPVRLVLS